MRLRPGVFLVTGFLCVGGVASAQEPSRTPPPAVSGKKSVVGQSQQPLTVTRIEEKVLPPPTENAPQPVGFESDVYCFGYLGDLSERFPVQVRGAENGAEQTDFITDDYLYISGGSSRGLKIGDEFWLVTPEQEVLHPTTGRSMGRLYQYRGRVVVTSLEPRAGIVRVTQACTDIPMGTYLKPFEPIPIPLARKSPLAVRGDPPSGKPRGRIVFTRDGVVALGSDSMVIVDVGTNDGLAPGDFLTVFRYAAGEEFGVRPIGSYWVNLPPPPGVVVPRTYLGEAVVLTLGERWAIVRLTDSFRLIQVGDEVEIK
jgi:hypothetical protein